MNPYFHEKTTFVPIVATAIPPPIPPTQSRRPPPVITGKDRSYFLMARPLVEELFFAASLNVYVHNCCSKDF